MPRKGITNNPKGRPKGSPNKITQDFRCWLSKLIDKNRDQIQRDLAALPPKERLQVLEKFMQYTIPKMQNAEAKLNLEKLTDEQIDRIVKELAEKL